MPRAESRSHYNSQSYGSAPYDDSPSPPATSDNTSSNLKKKHVCSECSRGFTTSGHLARHSRVHTGERNHKCPFPGCDTRCSRQDNLQQHYRIHLSPGSRRTSTRSSVSRVMNPRRGASVAVPSAPSDSEPPLSPPALEPARIYTHHSPPPDSPPPLAHATLPATAHHIPASHLSRSSSSPETTYSPSMVTANTSYYSYNRYHDQQTGGYNYAQSSTSLASYSDAHATSYNNSSLPHLNTSGANIHGNTPSPVSAVSVHSRHSISHISPPSSYPHASGSDGEPPSPASSHSVSSGPTTPAYNVGGYSQEEYHGTAPIVAGEHMHGYAHARYADSPPPILAPIHAHPSERSFRRASGHHSPSYGGQMHQSEYYPQYNHMEQWKADNAMRPKGISALV